MSGIDSAPTSTLALASHSLAERLNHKQVAAAYFTLAFATRLFLRSRHAADLSWVTVMLIQDAMSIMSFVVGLTYLHCTNGGFALAFLSQCGAPLAQSTSMQREEEEEADGGARRRTMRLFYFAM